MSPSQARSLRQRTFAPLFSPSFRLSGTQNRPAGPVLALTYRRTHEAEKAHLWGGASILLPPKRDCRPRVFRSACLGRLPNPLDDSPVTLLRTKHSRALHMSPSPSLLNTSGIRSSASASLLFGSPECVLGLSLSISSRVRVSGSFEKSLHSFTSPRKRLRTRDLG